MSTDSHVLTELPLAAGAWPVDTHHSSVEFTVRHLGLSKVRGRFNKFDATLEVGERLDETSLVATVDLSSVDTNEADRDAHLRGTDFFDTDNNPEMRFESTGIEGDGNEFELTGNLTINGVTAPLTLEVEFNGTEVYPMDQKVHAGFSAEGTLSRKAYGIDFDVPLGVDKVALGDKVQIELEVQFVDPS